MHQRCFGTKDDEAGKLVNNMYRTIKVPRTCRCQTATLNGLARKSKIITLCFATMRDFCPHHGIYVRVFGGFLRDLKASHAFLLGHHSSLREFPDNVRSWDSSVVMAEAAKSPKELVGCGKCGRNKKRMSYFANVSICIYNCTHT